MRKLKLQMQTSIDDFVARPNGELDWTSVSIGSVAQDIESAEVGVAAFK